MATAVLLVTACIVGTVCVSLLISMWALCFRLLAKGKEDLILPPYWETSLSDLTKSLERGSERGSRGPLADCYPVKVEHRASIQELMNATCGEQEKAFRLVRAARVENLAIWQRYQESARVVAKARGPCRFNGRPPATVQMAEDVDAGILSSLDSDVCEVYLWFGTKPCLAQRIAHEGFQVADEDGTVHFAEDMAKADEHAQPGEGLYRDCYAMLLCRVVLGKQQLTAPRAEGEEASPRDTMKYDSTLHEVPGRPRDFISHCPSMVYPEYMLVYERCEPGHLVAGAEHSKYWDYASRHLDWLFRAGSPSAGRAVVPGYWSNWNCEESFRETHPAVRFKPVIQRLMDSTWEAKYTRDRKGANGLRIPKGDPNGDMPTGVRVLKVLRVEDSAMWSRYAQTLSEISSHRTLSARLPGHPANTMAALDSKEQQRLAPSINEVYLWHGSSPHAVMSIAQSGFNLDLTGSATGAMFGRGAYFAESASKADEYSSDDRDGYYQGYFAMLLCRVVLGEVQHLLRADPEAHTRTGPGLSYDSTLGDREAAVGTYREFVVPSQEQIYPEYAIIYERLYEENRIR